MDNKAYIIQSTHFTTEEMNFEQLKEYTDNVILEYKNDDNKHFRRSLFELDRLKFNIGILLTDNTDTDIKLILKSLLESIRGFNINIGVWLNISNMVKLIDAYRILETSLSSNFITGIKGNYKNLLNDNYPVWKENGDIEDFTRIMVHFAHQTITTVKMNTDYKTIYKENKLKPLKSNEDISLLLK